MASSIVGGADSDTIGGGGGGEHKKSAVTSTFVGFNINDQYQVILQDLGGLGFFQKSRLVLLISISFFFFINFTTIFSLIPVDHKCYIPARDVEPYSEIDQSLWNKMAYPESDPTCKMYELSNTTNGSMFTREETTCTRYIKTHDNVKTSATAEFDLFCGKEVLPKVASAAYFVGMGFGALIFGYLADILGRKPVLIFCMLMNVIAVALNSLSLNFYMFIVCRVLVGMSWPHYMVSLTISAEMVIPKYVPILGFIFETVFGAGLAFLGFPVAYFVRNWRMLEMTSAAIGVCGVAAATCVPESLRWLIIKGKTTEAMELAEQIRICNDATIEKTELDRKMKAICEMATQTPVSDKKEKPLQNLYIIVTTPCLCSRVVILSFGWMVNSLMYYGFTLNTASLIPGNLYFNVVVGGLLEAPAMLAAFLLVDRIGRKGTMVIAYVLAGLSCAIVGVSYQTCPVISQIAGQSGKMCITLTFGVIYVYTLELVPTCVRTTGMSICSSMSRVGSICAPFIVLASELIWFPLTYVIYTIVVLITAALTMLLPETMDRPLQDTIEDAIHFTKCPDKLSVDRASGNESKEQEKHATIGVEC